MTIKAVIETLNTLTTGELTQLHVRVAEARDRIQELGHADIAALLDEALGLLKAFDVKGFRKKVQHAVSRLGHIKG